MNNYYGTECTFRSSNSFSLKIATTLFSTVYLRKIYSELTVPNAFGRFLFFLLTPTDFNWTDFNAEIVRPGVRKLSKFQTGSGMYKVKFTNLEQKYQ